jgi:hypothetical protein
MLDISTRRGYFELSTSAGKSRTVLLSFSFCSNGNASSTHSTAKNQGMIFMWEIPISDILCAGVPPGCAQCRHGT